MSIAPANQGALPRRFHAYCIGAAKTGTTTIADMARGNYRAAHEPAAEITNRLVIDYLERRLAGAELQAQLLDRDRRLNLELEAAHPLGYLCGTLAQLFPAAHFIVTLREPMAWLKSRLNFHFQARPPEWEEYRAYFWTRLHQGWATAEKPLQDLGLYSLDTYLQQYADHYVRVLREVPAGRRLLLRTHELDGSRDRLGKFLGVPPDTLGVAHSKQAQQPITPLAGMDPTFVRERIWRHCGSLITEYFPDSAREYEH